MKIKSPISVAKLQFYAYSSDETSELAFIDQFIFDDRRDFLIDRNTSGIAVKIKFDNERYDQGARRSANLTLVDVSSRCVIATKNIRVNIRKDEYFKDCYAYFPAEEVEIMASHSYKLLVAEGHTSETLAEGVFHLIDSQEHSHPTKWYKINDGGIRPAWEHDLYKSLRTHDGHDYYVRFNLAQKFGDALPAIMPELEMRLFAQDGRLIASEFKEPRHPSGLNYRDNEWFVELLFQTSSENYGIFYAELLCMEYPIAGFAFDAYSSEDQRGKWFGHDIEPLDEYSPEATAARLNDIPIPSNVVESDNFDGMLDQFIKEEAARCEAEREELAINQSEDGQQEDEMHPKVEEKPLLASLEKLTGLRSVKEKLTIYERVVRFNIMRADKGLPISSNPLHAMFLGSPGTGKTTVAKLMGSMLRRAGVLSKGHVVVRERANLLGQNYNSESEKTLAAIEEAQGGILFIDEAYQLYQPNDSRDPGKFVIETLLTALSDDTNRDWMLILAGYPDEMKRMFEMNPGFKSRIPDSNIYTFDDFTEAELMEIAENYLASHRFTMSAAARCALSARLKSDYTQREKNFGNARHVINMIQTEILPSMAVRVVNHGLNNETDLTQIQMADIPSPVIKAITSRARVGFAV